MIRNLVLGAAASALMLSLAANPAQAAEATGTVSAPPQQITDFLTAATNDPGSITADSAGAFIEALDGFLSSADGEGTQTTTYTYDMPELPPYVSTNTWITKGARTHLVGYSGSTETYFTPEGEFTRVFPYSKGAPIEPHREIYPLPRSVRIDWAHSNDWNVTCGVWCSWIGRPIYEGQAGEFRSVQAEPTGSDATQVTLHYENMTVTVDANLKTGSYSSVVDLSSVRDNAKVVIATETSMVTPVQDVALPKKHVASQKVYRKAWALDACSGTWFTDLSKSGYDQPSAADLKRHAGKVVKVKKNPCTYTIPKKAGTDGMWLVRVKAYKEYLGSGAFYYRPSDGYAESPQFRG